MNFTLSRISQHLLIDNFSIYKGFDGICSIKEGDIRTLNRQTRFPGDPNGENR